MFCVLSVLNCVLGVSKSFLLIRFARGISFSGLGSLDKLCYYSRG